MSKDVTELNKRINELEKELSEAKKKEVAAVDRQVKVEEELRTATSSNSEVIKKQTEEINELRRLLDQVEQNLVNTQKSKAVAMGVDHVQLATLTALVLPMCKDINGGPMDLTTREGQGAVEGIKRSIPAALQIIRTTLDEIAKL